MPQLRGCRMNEKMHGVSSRLLSWILIALCLMILPACSMKPTEIQYKNKLHLTPDSLLVDPCSPKEAGYTVRSLARGYVENTTCIRMYRILLEKQRKHKQQVMELYHATQE